MKRKFFILALFLFATCVSLFSQTENDTLSARIFGLLDLKHCYENSLHPELKERNFQSSQMQRLDFNLQECKNPIISLSNYKNSISIIRLNKGSYLRYISEELKKEKSSTLVNQYIVYDFEGGFNANKTNKISKLDYLKIFKIAFFDCNLEILPSLNDALKLINGDGNLNVLLNDTLFSKIFNILELKHNYEASVLIEQKRATSSPSVFKYILKTYDDFGIKISEPEKALKDYKDSVFSIKNSKNTYVNLIENELKKEKNSQFSRLFIFYDFQDPLSSIIYKENMMSKLDFLKLFKRYIFEDDLDVLTPLFVPKAREFKFSLQ